MATVGLNNLRYDRNDLFIASFASLLAPRSTMGWLGLFMRAIYRVRVVRKVR